MIDSVSGLYQMKAASPERALRQACQGFEAIFTGQLLKAVDVTPDKNGFASGMYQEMFNTAVADAVARGEGIGIAKMIYEQITGKGIDE
ncbi:MAG: rod-binding protein [Thermodesulfobacteriota bacterium]|nr:rod-binding protein [Thermodesulfobacteriota bacterium]